MKKKILISALGIVFIGAFGVWFYVFQYSKTHHRNVESEDATIVTAAKIVKDFQTNEPSADKSYLNKAIEVKGIILKKDKDQSGNTTLTIKSGDAFANIFCTLKSGTNTNTRDSVVVVKGICSGFLSDVVLNDAVLVLPGKTIE
jgi:hypothetical protein